MKRYTGERTIDGISVLVDGEPLSPHANQLKLTDYGFEWSYEGPEPSQLAFAILFDHLGNAAEAKSLYPSFMQRIVANFDNGWEMASADIDAAIAALRGERATSLASESLSMTLKYDQTIQENTMSVNGLYNSRSEFDPGACHRGGLRVEKGAGTVDANAAGKEVSRDALDWSRYDEVYAGAAQRRNVSVPDASGEAGRLASAQGARSTQAAQIANIAARLERLPLTSYQRGIFAIIATAWFFDSMDLGALTFVLGSIKQTFQLSTAGAGLLSSLSFLGMFVGAASAGLLADRFGRAKVFQTSMIFWGLGSLACGLSSTVTMLGASRLLLGFGMGMEFPVAQSMVSEIIPAERRGRYIAYLEGFWPLGFIVSGLLVYAVLSVADWHWVFILQAIPALFVLVIRRYVPESPRWLAAHGHSEQAETVMQEIESKVAGRLGRSQPPEAGPQPIAAPARVGLTTLFSGVYARRTTMLWTLWFFALLGFYGLTTWLGALLQAKGFPVTKSVFYTILISLAGIPGFLFSAWLVESWGRKGTLVLNLIGGAVACYFYGGATVQSQLIVAGLCMQFFLFGMWSALYAYTPELYPTAVRATGTGFASAVGRIGSLIGPTVIGLVLPTAGQSGVFALGAGAFVIAALAVLILGEETKGRTLEHISH